MDERQLTEKQKERINDIIGYEITGRIFLMENSLNKEVEYLIDDSPVVIPDYIKRTTREERNAKIAELEKEAREERDRLRKERESVLVQNKSAGLENILK